MQALTRRGALGAGLGFLSIRAQAARQAPLAEALGTLERSAGGRLGVAVLDTRSGQLLGHRLDERFAMCSTFKLPLAALLLHEVDRGRLRLRDWLRFGPEDRVPHRPVTEAAIAQGGLPLDTLIAAVQQQSDNLAANVLLREIGGPEGFSARLRELGDEVTRLDRLEPMLNDVPRGDERDTSTPAAMARTLARLLCSDWLSPRSHALLCDWMEETETGWNRVRAGFPQAWRAGDKTGTALPTEGPAKINDIAIAWPGRRAVQAAARDGLIVCCYYESAQPLRSVGAAQAAVLARAGRLAAQWWQSQQARGRG